MKELTIGRLPDNHIVIDNKMVSRHHAKIVMDRGGRYEIVDLDSKNGTYVNGRKVRGSQAVRPGDRIVFVNTPIPIGWESKFDQIPDDEPDPAGYVQPAVAGGFDSSLLAFALYDFDKDVDALFAKQTEKLKQIITDFKDNRIPVCRHSTVKHFSEEVLDLLVERYDFVGRQLTALLSWLDHESATFKEEYDFDMQKLNNTYQYYLRNSKGEADRTANLNKVDTRKGAMKQHYEEMRKAVLPVVLSLIDDYYAKNPPMFTNRMELAPADADLWKILPNPSDEIQKTFYLGEDVVSYKILQEPVELRKRVYVQSLYGGNLLFRYANKHRQDCFNAVNTLISRMLAATPGGKMQVVMVDTKEMEGTCGAFNSLNKGVYRVVSRPEDFTSMLNEELLHTESIIKKLRQGDNTNISEYNRTTNTEKLPFTLLVLKDIPTGRGYDFNEKLIKILHNGPRIGVSVLVLLDEQTDNPFGSAPIETCYFTSSSQSYNPSDTPQITLPQIISNDIVSAIVNKVNQALEVKTDTKLKFREYMLPESDWWKGESAERIDIPFGLTKDRQTTALQLTQQNAQNAAIVIGASGTGKSVFLHTIIASAATIYSPKELQLYLLDFSGVEFNVYARHKLPQALVIAPEAEREFGLSILREVFEEGNRRMALCRDKDVSDIVALKLQNPDLVVPRLLVIIDEFQKLFEVENDAISKEAESIIKIIIKEYRKFGINLILATQSLPLGIVPYNLIANRVVFKCEPNDFDNLIKWPYSKPKPLLPNGVCVYNSDSGAELANKRALTYYIDNKKKKPTELDDFLDKITTFAGGHSEKVGNHVLRTFRSNELPIFTNRILAKQHEIPQKVPREVGVYLGESIAIAPYHVYVPLTKESNNNILVMGGDPSVAKGIAYHAILSAISEHTENSCHSILLNFMTENDPMQEVFHGSAFTKLRECGKFNEESSPKMVGDCLQTIKTVIDACKERNSILLTHFFIYIIDFQRGRMFDNTDDQNNMISLLEYILKNGPRVGVFTLLQVDNLTNLNKIDYNPQELFCHRIALQMSEADSDKIIGNSAANKLLVNNQPATKYRGLYYNNVNNSITKFKPYSL